MPTEFMIQPLTRGPFEAFLQMDAESLAPHNASWLTVDACPGYPCRVSLVDARIGERVLAIPFTHHDVRSPYRASGPVFVREHAAVARVEVNEVPEFLRHRPLSIRGYDAANYLIAASVIEGSNLESELRQQLSSTAVQYIHIHNASSGCYICSARRAR